MSLVREPAVAGVFYPADPGRLAATVDEMIAVATLASRPPGRLQALLVPHAGHRFSGPTAAAGYSLMSSRPFSRVVLLGPCHRVAVRGLALPKADVFRTPLGAVRIERPSALTALPQVVTSDEAHAEEHSLEVQLPFMQRLLGNFTLVPLAVGRADPAEVAQVIESASGPDTLTVISTDLSHYLPDATARSTDRDTIERICGFEPLGHRQACGATPTNGLLRHAHRHGWRPTVLAYATSADAPIGNPDRVVGYLSAAFTEPDSHEPDTHEPDSHADRATDRRGRAVTASTTPGTESDSAPTGHPDGRVLPVLARAAVAGTFGLPTGGAPPTDAATQRWLREPGACFVTVTEQGRLRGCIGSLTARRPLGEDVAANAIAACTQDRRFAPLRPEELAGVRLSVSVLSPPTPIDGITSRDQALAAIHPGDGVVFTSAGRRSTFLPQVWQGLPDPAQFLDRLIRKAGFGTGYWADDARVARYDAHSWAEPEGDPP